jgi:ADP-heptose:LPS heptosyltransferase
VPYVYPDPARVQSWGERLRPFSGFKIGVNWQGNPTFHGDKFRSIPLRYFAPLAQVPGVRLFSVQKGPGLDQVATSWEQVPMTVFDDLASDGTLHDTAALMQHLDLVITSDTAVAHLAGALGRPTWVLLARNSDWRWLIDRPDSPWYPTMRLFRQWTLGDWTTVFDRVAAALQQRLNANPRSIAATS